VHLQNQPKVDTRAPKTSGRPKKTKSALDRAMEPVKKQSEVSKEGRYKLYNTLSFYCKTKDDCLKKLNDVKAKYEIAIGTNHNKPSYGKELYNISFVN
jgi:hypothetical protein